MISKRFFLLWLILMVFTPLLLFSGEKENLDLVLKVLDNIPRERRSLLADNGGFGSSILVRSVSDTSEDPLTFVVAVPLNADFAVACAIRLAEKIQTGYTKTNIIAAFLGDEENSITGDLGEVSHKGLRDLLTLADMPENWILCYIDINEAPEKIIIRHGISGYVAPLEIMKPLPRLLNSHDIPWNFKIRHNGIYKLGLVEGPQALFIAWDNEINGFVLSGLAKQKRAMGGGPIAKFLYSDDTVSEEKFADCLLEYADLLTSPVIMGDRYYSHFRLPGGKAMFISEGLTAALLLIIVAILLIFYLFSSARFNAVLIFNFKLFLKYFWFFLILLPLLVFSVKISGILYSILLVALNPVGNVLNNTGAGFALLLGALFFLLPAPALDFIRIPKRPQFFSVSAIIFSTLGFFFAAFLDFSYVPAFLWAFLFVFIGSLTKNYIGVFFCIIMIPVFALDWVFNIIETGSTRAAELLITSSWKNPDAWIASVITALFLLPFFLLLRRGYLMWHSSKHHKRKPKRKSRLLVIPGLVLIVLSAMILQILILSAETQPERRFYAVKDNENLSISMDSILFQDSRIITLRITAEETPVRFDMIIESENGISLPPVYSAPVPFFREEGGRKISFSLGENPPNPLIMEIVVSVEFSGKLSVTALYNAWNPVLDPLGAPVTDDYILGLTGSISL